MDVRSFLARHPPFDALEPQALDRVVSSVQIEHFAPGAVILREAGAPASHLYVVRRGRVEIVDDHRVVDEVGEGGVFGMWSLLGQVAPSATVRAAEDTLCYLIAAEVASAVLRTAPGIAFVAASARRRLDRADEALGVDIDLGRYRAVGDLLRRPPVTCTPDTPVAEAAELMSRERVSSLLVPLPDGGLGILTDRDLRSRVVAERRGGDTPVREVMTPRAQTIPADTMVGEVLLRMLEGGFHHFPVEGADGRVAGVVTDTDLMGVGRATPFALKSAIERAPDRDAVAEAMHALPDVVTALVDASADPVDVGHVVAFAIDAATRRLLALGAEEIGPAVPWAWLAFGSAARQEQALRTDQDHGLAYEGDPEVAEPALGALAEFVTEGLERAGLARCNAEVMATNPALRLPVAAWVERLRFWIVEEQGPTASEQLSIVADFRRVAGTADAEPALDRAVAEARGRSAFVRQLAHRALDLRPPIGIAGGLVVDHGGQHRGTVDLKHGGILIIGNLARVHAVRSGVRAKRTIDRLRAAGAAGAIDAETREGLEEAFRFLWEIRLRHHVGRLRAGEPPDDFVRPDELGHVALQGLKEALRIVARAQRTLALDLGLVGR